MNSQQKQMQVVAMAWKDNPSNELFKMARKQFLPYITKKIAFDNQFDRQEILAYYDIVVLRCLDNYIGLNGALFMTYLYYSVIKVIPKYFEKKPKDILVDNYILDNVLDLNEIYKDY